MGRLFGGLHYSAVSKAARVIEAMETDRGLGEDCYEARFAFEGYFAISQLFELCRGPQKDQQFRV